MIDCIPNCEEIPLLCGEMGWIDWEAFNLGFGLVLFSPFRNNKN
jgi:hypothetical protein